GLDLQHLTGQDSKRILNSKSELLLEHWYLLIGESSLAGKSTAVVPAHMAPERNLSTTALMERIPSSTIRINADVSLQAMGVQHTFSLGTRGDLLREWFLLTVTWIHGWNNWGKAENETSACFYEYRDLPRKICNMGKRTHEGRSRTVLLHAFIDPNPEGPWLAALRIPLST
ncbi:hypothetical protein Tco_0824812, partial [Tanacetum coccineum]